MRILTALTPVLLAVFSDAECQWLGWNPCSVHIRSGDTNRVEGDGPGVIWSLQTSGAFSIRSLHQAPDLPVGTTYVLDDFFPNSMGNPESNTLPAELNGPGQWWFQLSAQAAPALLLMPTFCDESHPASPSRDSCLPSWLTVCASNQPDIYFL